MCHHALGALRCHPSQSACHNVEFEDLSGAHLGLILTLESGTHEKEPLGRIDTHNLAPLSLWSRQVVLLVNDLDGMFDPFVASLWRKDEVRLL